jgi:hypothetical protein
VSDNRELRRIFGPKREEDTGGWEKLRSEIFHSFHSLPNIRTVKARRMRRAGHLTRMRKLEMRTKF